MYYIYILSNKSKTLYTGYTKDLLRRIHVHRMKRGSEFTARYNISKLVYYEEGADWHSAKVREKQIKGWLRAKKIKLIESMNPQWEDLSVRLSDPSVSTKRTPQDRAPRTP